MLRRYAARHAALIRISTLSVLTVLLNAGGRVATHVPSEAGWADYGATPEGTRYSAANQINRTDVSRLKLAWTFHTGVFTGADGKPNPLARSSAFETTPILSGHTLYLSTPVDQVIALDAETGKKLWFFDPHLIASRTPGMVTSRGVAAWKDPTWKAANAKAKSPPPCGERVFIGTMDARLFSVDAQTGAVCRDFGNSGSVDLTHNVRYQPDHPYQITSPPTVVGNVVVVGSSIGDNIAADMEAGVVRGFDVRSGKLLWTWDPIPWSEKQNVKTGAANAWSVISADIARGIIYIPTGSASPDFFGGLRAGDNRNANSMVAIEAASGKFLWAFQVVHHDLWDYDIASQPVLFDFQHRVPAIAITTKMGMVFVLNRLTGEPLVPVTERAVPKSHVPDEKASPTQPFSSLPPLGPLSFDPKTLWGRNAQEEKVCRDKVSALHSEGIYTPPSTTGTLLYPGNVGGVNWGSPAFDPQTGILYANTNHVAFAVTLMRRSEVDSLWGKGQRYISRVFSGAPSIAERIARQKNRFTGELSGQFKTPYYVFREAVLSPSGLPCTPQPWGALVAMDLNQGRIAFSVPLGTMIPGQHTGSINLGGPIATAGGLIFTAATIEPYLRAFDSSTGQELWKGHLPVPAQSTPMTYSIHNKQYVVICAGGHSLLGTPLGDSVVAFALP